MPRAQPRAHSSRVASCSGRPSSAATAPICRQLTQLPEVGDGQSASVDVAGDGCDQGAFGERHASLAIKRTQLACSKPGITAKGAMLCCALTFATTCQIAAPSPRAEARVLHPHPCVVRGPQMLQARRLVRFEERRAVLIVLHPLLVADGVGEDFRSSRGRRSSRDRDRRPDRARSPTDASACGLSCAARW
jgi:hypothetical protein